MSSPRYRVLEKGAPPPKTGEPVINWKKDPAFKVTIGEWEITGTTPRQLSVLHIRLPERGPFLLSLGDNGWECTYTDAFGKSKMYSQNDMNPPKNQPIPYDAAQYIQKAFQALDVIQKSDEARNNSGGNIHRDTDPSPTPVRAGFKELQELKIHADSVIDSGQARGLTLETQLHLPPTTPPARQRTVTSSSPMV